MSGTPIPELSQDAAALNLRWRANDAVSLSWRVRNVDWTGTYRAEVRDKPSRAGALLGTFVVVTAFDATPTPEAPLGKTTFTITMADASDVKGDAWWDLQEDGGRTKLAGRVFVTPDVTV
jgi:hypothetical protein